MNSSMEQLNDLIAQWERKNKQLNEELDYVEDLKMTCEGLKIQYERGKYLNKCLEKVTWMFFAANVISIVYFILLSLKMKS